MTRVQEEILHCCIETSSGKQKRVHSTSQQQLRSEKTPATIEENRILLALQQLATNSNSANLNNNNNINRISKWPKCLPKKMPTFDRKSEKFELYKDLFQTSLRIHNRLMEEEKLNYFHSPTRGDALQSFQNLTSLNRENLGEFLSVFRRKYINPQSMTTAKRLFHGLVFNSGNQKLIVFFQKSAKSAFKVATQAITEQFI